MKKLILLSASVTLLLAACFCAWPGYQQHRQARWLDRARAFLIAGDRASASLSARQVLKINPKNIEACTIMAGLAELAHSPSVVDWCQRIAELSPTIDNRLKVASSALHSQRPPYELTSQTLRGLEAEAADVPAFHVLSAELALKLNQLTDAATHFQEAASLEPHKELHQLNLAAVNLQSTNQQLVAGARVILERLSTNSQLGMLALRWRVADSLRRVDFGTAELISCQVLTNARANLDDRLQHLNILQLSQNPVFIRNLDALQGQVATHPAEIYAVSEWMRTHGLADSAGNWLRRLDAKLRETQPVPLGMAKLYLEQRDWEGLEVFLADRKWAELEFMRLAFLARTSWEQGHELAGDTRWHGAARAAGGSLGKLSFLLNLAAEWGHDPEELLYQIGQSFPREHWALRELERRYMATGNTRGLNGVYAICANNRLDITNCNNFATTSLLLKINLAKASEMARELYLKQPNDAIIASTYAYSLHLQGRTQAGLEVLDRCGSQALHTPSVALYYAVLLSAAAHPDAAKQYLALAQSARLLPEEKQLLDETKASAGVEALAKPTASN